jgi:type 1 glutamine amidotransferase
MKSIISILLILFTVFDISPAQTTKEKSIRILVVTGGHDYNKETFNDMLSSLGSNISFRIVEFPSAFDMFLPENRNSYDVLIFYHMWQKITPQQENVMAECIKSGKPLVVLHHSICAFDDWEEYMHITGGRYFHKPAVIMGNQYPVSTYIHDLHFMAQIADTENPVTKGVKDFKLFDETYKGYYVEPGVKILITTTDTTSTPVIAWTKRYGKAKVVTFQSGHDTPTFQNPNFRKLLKQAIEYVTD